VRLLVTGGTGFIASHAVTALRQRGHDCVRLDLIPPRDGASGFVRGDVRDRETVAHAMAGCQAVLHLAAAHHDYGLSAATYHSVNVTGTDVVIETMEREGIRSLAFLSTAAVYGSATGRRTERTPTNPTSPYGVTKLEAEGRLVRWAANGPDRSLLVLRPTVVFGPENYANMFTLIRQIDRGRFPLVGSGTNHKSLAYVANLVAALLERWPLPSVPGTRIYNYADTPDLTSRDIALVAYRALGRSAPRWAVPMPVARALALPFDLATTLTGRDFGLSTARLRKFAEAETALHPEALEREGYRAPISLADGIATMVEWYRAVRQASPPAPRLPPETVLPWQGC